MRSARVFGSAAVMLAVCVLLSCSGSHGSHGAAPRAARPAQRPASPGAAMVLQVTPAPYQLPAGISREVLLPDAGSLLIIGGLTPSGASANTVTSLDPVTGGTRPAGRLAQATHDAAGFAVGGHVFVLGGGTSVSVPTVQALAPGTQAAVVGAMSRPRSDSNGVAAGPAGYVVGGYDGTVLDPQVLGTTDGRHFRVAARLPVPVRYAGTAVLGGLIWVFGGETAAGATDVIQRVDPVTGAAVVVGHLPQPVQGAAAISLGGQVFVAGGAAPGGTSRAVLRFDPATSRVSAAGELPVPVGYAGATVAGGVGYLVGGEDGTRTVPAVTTFRLVADGPAAAPWLAAPSGPGRLAAGSDPSTLPADVLIADHHNNRLLIVDPQGRIRWEFPRPGDLAPGQTFLQPDDAFFSPDGKYIIATQEDDQVISVISLAPGASSTGTACPGCRARDLTTCSTRTTPCSPRPAWSSRPTSRTAGS